MKMKKILKIKYDIRSQMTTFTLKRDCILTSRFFYLNCWNQAVGYIKLWEKKNLCSIAQFWYSSLYNHGLLLLGVLLINSSLFKYPDSRLKCDGSETLVKTKPRIRWMIHKINWMDMDRWSLFLSCDYIIFLTRYLICRENSIKTQLKCVLNLNLHLICTKKC